MRKIYLNSQQDFIEWKQFYDDGFGNLHIIASNYDEREPISYPCVLFETEGVDGFGDSVTKYGFVYLSDFITNYSK